MPSFGDFFRPRTRTEVKNMENSRTQRIQRYLRALLANENNTPQQDVSDIPKTETTRQYGINSQADRGLFQTIVRGIKNLISRIPGLRNRIKKVEENPRDSSEVVDDLSRALDDLRERSGERLAKIAQSLQSGRITPDQFRTQVVSVIREMHLGAAILGVGGAGNLSSYHLSLVNQAVNRQVQFLDRFVEQIRSRLGNDQPITSADVARTKQYASAVRSTAVQARRQLMLNEFPQGRERRRTNPAEHCPDCLEYESEGWQAVGTLPPIGDSQCGDNCKCTFEYDNNDSQVDEFRENDADGVASETTQ